MPLATSSKTEELVWTFIDGTGLLFNISLSV
jgi:hypothetical protein